MKKVCFLWIILVHLFFQSSVNGRIPQRMTQVLQSPLSPYANGTRIIELENFLTLGNPIDYVEASQNKTRELSQDNFTENKLNFPPLNLTPGHYHFLIHFQIQFKKDSNSPFLQLALLDKENVLIKKKEITFNPDETKGKWLRIDLDSEIKKEGEYFIQLNIENQFSLFLDQFMITPRLSTNIAPMASLKYASQVTSRKINNPPESISLSGPWQLQPSMGDLLTWPLEEKWENTPVNVPSPWNVNKYPSRWNEESFYKKDIGGNYVFYPSYPQHWEDLEEAWLRKKFHLPNDWKGLWQLHFDSVMFSSELYVNGQYVGYHEDGFTPFAFDITEYLNPGEENEILVGVRSWRHYTIGKGRPFPWGSFWGDIINGIWQKVTLRPATPVTLTNLQIIPMKNPYRLQLNYELFNSTHNEISLSFNSHIAPIKNIENIIRQDLPSLSVKGLKIPSRTAITHFEIIEWDDPHLWEPEDPFLYLLNTTLYIDGQTLYSFQEKFGFRIFETIENHLHLNSKRSFACY